MHKEILVTGATGFTGGHLCLRLAEMGCRVRALARSPKKASRLEACGITVIPGELKDRNSLLKAAQGCDTVYHIAAAYRQEGISDKEFKEVNVTGTENMLEAAREAGVGRFVHCSTVGVHGHIEHPPADESAPFNPGDVYQETKLAGEMLAQDYIRSGKIKGAVFRPSGIYGPGDTRFLKLFRHIKSGRFRMIGSGNVLYHLTYIDDLVEGIILCGTKSEALGRTYILAGPESMTLRELAGTIADIFGVTLPRMRVPFWPVYLSAFLCECASRPFGLEPPLYRRRVDFFRKDRAFDISRARAELGYSPKVHPGEGLARTADWYIKNGLL